MSAKRSSVRFLSNFTLYGISSLQPNSYTLVCPFSLKNSRYDTIDTSSGNRRDIRNVFKRSLDELTMDAVNTVLDLINQGSLYNGDEYKNNTPERIVNDYVAGMTDEYFEK